MVAALAAVTMLAAPFALLHGGAAPAAATARDAGRSVDRPGSTDLSRTQLVASDKPTKPLTAAERRHDAARRHQEAIHDAKVDHAVALQAAEALRGLDREHRLVAHHDAVVRATEERHATAVHRAEARHAAAVRAAKLRHRRTTRHAGGPRTRQGIATWYAWHPGQCASPFLPHGTLITVTDLATHKTIQCLVTDTEAHNPGRVVDLSNYCFEELAPLSQGVIMVRISW